MSAKISTNANDAGHVTAQNQYEIKWIQGPRSSGRALNFTRHEFLHTRLAPTDAVLRSVLRLAIPCRCRVGVCLGPGDRGSHVGERPRHSAAHRLHGRDDGRRDSSCDEIVFEGSTPASSFKKRFKS